MKAASPSLRRRAGSSAASIRHALALPAGEPTGSSTTRWCGSTTPGLAQGLDPRPDRQHARREGRKLVPRWTTRMRSGASRAWPGCRCSAGIAGIGDDDVAARHHRIVQRLHRRAAGIGAVIGGDERQLQRLAGGKRRPRPGARERHGRARRPRLLAERGRARARSAPYASGFLVAAGKAARRRPWPATRRRGGRPRWRRGARAPTSVRPLAISTAVRSAPPASRSGMICRMVRPLSGWVSVEGSDKCAPGWNGHAHRFQKILRFGRRSMTTCARHRRPIIAPQRGFVTGDLRWSSLPPAMARCRRQRRRTPPDRASLPGRDRRAGGLARRLRLRHARDQGRGPGELGRAQPGAASCASTMPATADRAPISHAGRSRIGSRTRSPSSPPAARAGRSWSAPRWAAG